MKSDSSPPTSSPAEHQRARSLPGWQAVLLIVPLAVAAMICSMAIQDLRNDHVAASWPVAEATIVSGHVTFRNQPAVGKHPAWTGWCVTWIYTYPWGGRTLGGTLQESTPSNLSPGCFSYRERAERQASRRLAGSTVLVRIDPRDPWASTAEPASIHWIDVVVLLAGSMLGASCLRRAGAKFCLRRPRPG